MDFDMNVARFSLLFLSYHLTNNLDVRVLPTVYCARKSLAHILVNNGPVSLITAIFAESQ